MIFTIKKIELYLLMSSLKSIVQILENYFHQKSQNRIINIIIKVININNTDIKFI